MASGGTFEIALAGAYLLLFGLTYGISRLGLCLAVKYRSHWYVIASVHFCSFFLSATVIAHLMAMILSRLPNDFYYFEFSRGCLIYTQILLFAGDLFHAHLQRGYVLIIAALLAAAAGYTAARLNPYPVMKPGYVDRLLEQRLAQAISNGSTNNVLITAMRDNFPHEYQVMLGTYRKNLRQAAVTNESKFVEAYYRVDKDFIRDVRQLAAAHQTDIEHAPEKALLSVVEAQLAMLDVTKDPRVCAAIVGGTLLTPALSAAPSSHDEDVAARNALSAKIVAARLGIEHSVQRDPTSVPKVAQLEYTRELYKTMKREEIALVGHIEQIRKADPRTQCDIGIGVYRAVLRLPTTDAAQLIAYMIAHSPS